MKTIFYWIIALLCCFRFARGAEDEWHVYYTRYDQDYWQIWMSDFDFQTAFKVTDDPCDKRCLRADSKHGILMYRDNLGKVFRHDIKNNETEPLMLGFEVVKDFDFREDCGFLVASYAPNAIDNIRIWHISDDLSEKTICVEKAYLNIFPRWIRSCRDYTYVFDGPGKDALLVGTIGEAQRMQLHSDFNTISDLSVNDSGEWLAFSGGLDGTYGDLWLSTCAGDSLVKLHAGPGLDVEPCWTPDGEWILFSTWDGENMRIARIRSCGEDFKYLSPTGINCRSPVVVNNE